MPFLALLDAVTAPLPQNNATHIARFSCDRTTNHANEMQPSEQRTCPQFSTPRNPATNKNCSPHKSEGCNPANRINCLKQSVQEYHEPPRKIENTSNLHCFTKKRTRIPQLYSLNYTQFGDYTNIQFSADTTFSICFGFHRFFDMSSKTNALYMQRLHQVDHVQSDTSFHV